MLASLISHQITFEELLGTKIPGHSGHQSCQQPHWKAHSLTPPVLKVDRPAMKHIKDGVRNHIASNADGVSWAVWRPELPTHLLIKHPLKYRNFYLYSAVSPVCYDNVSIRIYSYSSWCIKLPVSFSIWSKLQHEFSLLVKYLYGLKQKPEYGMVSNISNLVLPVHLLIKGGIEEFPTHTHTHACTLKMGEKAPISPSTPLHHTAFPFSLKIWFISDMEAKGPRTLL